MAYILAIDIGTTHCKAVTFTSLLQPVNTLQATYSTINDKTGKSEQDADEIFTCVQDLIQQSLSATNQIQGICFSAAMHSIIAVDTNGKPLTNAVIWSDTRSTQQAEQLKNSDTGKLIYERTGTPIHPMTPLCKIIWLKEAMPEIFQQSYKFISIKEYIFFKLFGKYIIDYSIASATGLFDIQQLTWCDVALQAAGITPDTLSVPVPVTHIEHAVKEEYKQLFVPGVIPSFIVGANDGCLANLGCGAVGNNEAALTIGTSGAVRKTSLQIHTDTQQRIFTYLLSENIYITGGAINNGGIVLEWLGKLLSENNTSLNVDELLHLADAATAGAGGLLFLPYILGERAPMWDAYAKGVFFGLNIQHGKTHIVRSVIEGICLAIRNVIQAIEETDSGIDAIYASGGFIKSSFWLQLMADVTGKKILLNNSEDASATGAAIVGLQALGLIKNLQDAVTFFTTKKIYVPDKNNHTTYQPLFSLFQSLYPKLKDDFYNITQLQKHSS